VWTSWLPNHRPAAGWSGGSAFIAVEEHCVSEIRWLEPVTEADFTRVADHVTACRQAWERHLRQGLAELIRHLVGAGYEPFTVERQPNGTGRAGALGSQEVMLSARLKDTSAIIAKMRRFGEPLRVMLDIWGYRVMVATEQELDQVAGCCAELWDTPNPEELLLRHGQLQFHWWRDYRQRSHAGLSPATTPRYDHAIHLNRRAPFGIVEIQVMTVDLYARVHGHSTTEDSHDQFTARRQELLRRKVQW
jgi:hypothetical protein